MRIFTLTLSILVHVAAVIAVVVVPIIATDVLPEPRRTMEFQHIVPITIAPPPPLRPRHMPQPTHAPADSAPVTVPDGIEPEPVAAPLPTSIDAGSPTIEGILMIGDVVSGDPVPPPAPRREPLPVGGSISRPERIHYVAPGYPAIARSARVEGTVILEAVLGADGLVREVRVLRSIPLLDAAAVQAVQQWRFTPTLLNGTAVPVVMTVTAVFSLQ